MTPEQAQSLLNTHVFGEDMNVVAELQMKSAINYAEEALYVEWMLWVQECVEQEELQPVPDKRFKTESPDLELPTGTSDPRCTYIDEPKKIDIVLALSAVPDEFTVQYLSSYSRQGKKFADEWAEAAIAEGWLEYVDPDAFEDELCADSKQGEKVPGTIRVADWGLYAAVVRKLLQDRGEPLKTEIKNFTPNLSGLTCSNPSVRFETTDFNRRVLSW